MKNEPVLVFTILHMLFMDSLNNRGAVRGCRQIVFKHRWKNKALQGHTLRTVRAKDNEDCRLKCFLEDNCVSVNYASTRKCDLNNKDHTQKPNDLEDVINNTYSFIENPCASSPCQHPSVLCQAGFTDRGYRCVYNKTGLASEKCEKAVLRIFIKSFGTKDRPGGRSIFGDTIIEVNGVNHCKSGRGHNIVTVYPGNGSIHASESFDTFVSGPATEDMTAFINNLPENVMVLITVHDSAKAGVMSIIPGAESALRSVGAVDPVFPKCANHGCLLVTKVQISPRGFSKDTQLGTWDQFQLELRLFSKNILIHM